VLRGDAAGCRFLASMHYRIIPTDPEKYDVQQGRWRVTTSAYLYEFPTPEEAKLWAMHWHPAGPSGGRRGRRGSRGDGAGCWSERSVRGDC
jgi:hypothetical protein